MTRVAVFLIGLVTAAAATAEPPECKLIRIAEWKVRGEFYRPVVAGAINGQTVGVLLDTGSSVSLMQRSVAERLRLPRIAGEAGALETTLIQEFKIGKTVRSNWRVLLADQQDFGDDLAVLIGDDFFQQADVEFDLRRNAVRLYQAKNCEGARLAYWTRDPLEVPLADGDKIQLTVAVNGQPVRALLDTGAGRSLLSRARAADLGITSHTAGVTVAGCARGFAAGYTDSWSAQFDTFTIGEEVVRNPRLRFAELSDPASAAETQPQMLLGVDFLRSHRVLVARSQRKIYFTYEGGAVFPSATAWGCNAPR